MQGAFPHLPGGFRGQVLGPSSMISKVIIQQLDWQWISQDWTWAYEMPALQVSIYPTTSSHWTKLILKHLAFNNYFNELNDVPRILSSEVSEACVKEILIPLIKVNVQCDYDNCPCSKTPTSDLKI